MGNGTDDSRRTGGMASRVVTPFPVLITVLYLALTALFMALPALVPSVGDALDPIIGPEIRFIAMVILGVIFLLVIISSAIAKPRAPANSPPKSVRFPQQAATVPDTAPGKAPARPATQVKQVSPPVPRTFVYPDMVEGGIYGDTYIKLEGERTLKIRTQVVGPELVA